MKKINLILKAEALIFLIITILVYSAVGASWWMFLILLFVPDIFMLGYLKNPKTGACVYNIGHTYVTPFLLIVIFTIFHIFPLLPILLIWLAHISMDRVLGYGLKLETGFKNTHLQDTH